MEIWWNQLNRIRISMRKCSIKKMIVRMRLSIVRVHVWSTSNRKWLKKRKYYTMKMVSIFVGNWVDWVKSYFIWSFLRWTRRTRIKNILITPNLFDFFIYMEKVNINRIIENSNIFIIFFHMLFFIPILSPSSQWPIHYLFRIVIVLL